jgi:hypothetical protein
MQQKMNVQRQKWPLHDTFCIAAPIYPFLAAVLAVTNAFQRRTGRLTAQNAAAQKRSTETLHGKSGRSLPKCPGRTNCPRCPGHPAA